MSKIAFLFPGQGSQYAGMGKSLAGKWPVAARVFEEADDALGFPLSKLCFEGPEDQLKLTENTQPALLTVSTAAFAVLKEHGVTPDLVAGHSLGETSALVVAGAIAFTDAVRLVRNRGRYMQEAVPARVGAMAALMRLPEGKLDGVLSGAAQGEVVSAANMNAPDQIVIAGHAGAVQRAVELAKAAGARRAVLLPVSAPFHCSLMAPAQQRLSVDLNATAFRDLACPLVNNWQAAEIRTAEEARRGLYEQVPNPVRWIESVKRLAALGAERFIEVGAGGVLTGLLRYIEPDKKGAKFGEAEDWDKLNAFLTALRSLTIVFAATALAPAQSDWQDIQPRQDLKGWTRLAIAPDPQTPESQWKVVDGVLVCEGNKGHEWLRFDHEFGDFVFHVEFRYTPREGDPRYNSGIFIRNAADFHIWHQVQIGGASGGYIFGNTPVEGQVKRINLRDKMTEMRVKPAGEWNQVDVTAKGTAITSSVNGAVVSEFIQCEFPRGYIGLEAEGYRIEFRNLKLKSLP